MSALLPIPFSAPAERVEAVTDHGTQRFSRTLSDRNPHLRSSTAVIVPMDADEFDKADRLVMRASLICAVVLATLLVYEWISAL